METVNSKNNEIPSLIIIIIPLIFRLTFCVIMDFQANVLTSQFPVLNGRNLHGPHIGTLTCDWQGPGGWGTSIYGNIMRMIKYIKLGWSYHMARMEVRSSFTIYQINL